MIVYNMYFIHREMILKGESKWKKFIASLEFVADKSDLFFDTQHGRWLALCDVLGG